MGKQFLIIVSVAAVLILGYFFIFSGNEVQGTILYYGDTCPHCENVEKYINDNNIEAKVPMERKEVYRNLGNAREMADKAKSCGLPTEQMGVPFLWIDGQCLVGDQPIIEYLGKK